MTRISRSVQRITGEATRSTCKSIWVYAYVLWTVRSRLHRGHSVQANTFFQYFFDLQELRTSAALQSENIRKFWQAVRQLSLKFVNTNQMYQNSAKVESIVDDSLKFNYW